MRLIDADELKKELANLVVGGEEKLKDYYINGSKLDENAWIGGIYDAWELIEDAPTVEPTFGMFREMLCAECGKRPQGKWEEYWQEDLDFMSRKGWKCPFCKWRTTYGTPNFCMNCGADLREEGDET